MGFEVSLPVTHFLQKKATPPNPSEEFDDKVKMGALRSNLKNSHKYLQKHGCG